MTSRGRLPCRLSPLLSLVLCPTRLLPPSPRQRAAHGEVKTFSRSCGRIVICYGHLSSPTFTSLIPLERIWKHIQHFFSQTTLSTTSWLSLRLRTRILLFLLIDAPDRCLLSGPVTRILNAPRFSTSPCLRYHRRRPRLLRHVWLSSSHSRRSRDMLPTLRNRFSLIL